MQKIACRAKDYCEVNRIKKDFFKVNSRLKINIIFTFINMAVNNVEYPWNRGL